MLTGRFWLEVIERMVSAGAASFGAAVAATNEAGRIDWKAAAAAALVVAALSVCKSLAGSRVGDPESPSPLP